MTAEERIGAGESMRMQDEGESMTTSKTNEAPTARDLTVLEAASLLSGSTEWESRPLPARGIASFVMSDGPHGVRRQLGAGDHLGIAESEKSTCFPTAATVANSWDPELAEQMGRALGQEALALGVDVLLGPGLNIKRSPLCGRNFEYYSEDPILAGRMAAGLVRGIQSQGVAACPKHFAVNSQELRRMASDSIVDERTMREIYLTAFEIVVREAFPRTIMSSYNLVNGTYANENRHLLTEILREEWGFNGMVITDWGGCNSAVAAVSAGGGLEMPAPGLDEARSIVAAVEAGELEADDVYARAAEVLAVARAARSFGPRPVIDAEFHHDLARRIAEESVVLLKNEDGALPLRAGAKVAIIGDMASTPRYQGSGSSQINPTSLETTVDVIADFDLDVVGFAQGYERLGGSNPSLTAEAVELARKADVVLVYIGLDELAESEGIDREHMRLADVQVDLLQALKSTGASIIAVLSAGSAVETDWARYTDAIVHQSLSGQAGSSATLRILTGAVNPSGRLSETYPIRFADLPVAAWYPARGPMAYYREGPYVGYRYTTSAAVPVAFPFGFGLSYSTFDYSDLIVDDSGVRFTLTNTSNRDGSEVSQLYVESPGGVWGPVRQLKGFAKTRLLAGESREIRISFDDYTFRHFDTGTNSWAHEGGDWTIIIGRNVEQIALKATLQRSGATHCRPTDLGHYQNADVANVTDEEFESLLGRPIPVLRGDGTLESGDPLSAMAGAKSRVARLAVGFLEGRKRKAEAGGHPDLNILFMLNMPFRALAKMTRGAVSSDMVDGFVDFANGRTLRGLRTVVGGFFANRRANARTQRDLDSAGENWPTSD